jgi:VCBS repeat-containing protein
MGRRNQIYLAHGVWMNEPGCSGCLVIIIVWIICLIGAAIPPIGILIVLGFVLYQVSKAAGVSLGSSGTSPKTTTKVKGKGTFSYVSKDYPYVKRQDQKKLGSGQKRRNILITIADGCTHATGTIPISGKDSKTITEIQYETLIEKPFKYTEYEFQKEVHHVRRNKPHLKIDKYDIRRSMLCKEWGWGIYINKEGAIGLVGCESDRYKELMQDVSVKKIKAFGKGRSEG